MGSWELDSQHLGHLSRSEEGRGAGKEQGVLPGPWVSAQRGQTQEGFWAGGGTAGGDGGGGSGMMPDIRAGVVGDQSHLASGSQESGR